jgi:hypothetical protein
MKIAKATARYEQWLGKHLRLLPEDLELKHQQMRSAVFPFFRATYYRWAQIWADVCGEAARAPSVLAVGDLHVENFGTWRDIEGRLIWGVNDFDETWRLPYTNDLIRLATSALLAGMGSEAKEGVASILTGYLHTLEAGGRPFALAEHHPVLRFMATARLHEPEKYWEKLHALPDVSDEPPADALKGIARMMPERGLHWRVVHRVAGLGSLGRERYVALAEWRGGSIAREAKGLAPSACLWAAKGKGTAPIHYQRILDIAVRCADPFVRMHRNWLIRRLAPDCSRIELSALPAERDEFKLLHAMGMETANIHLGSRKASVLTKNLNARPRGCGWLFQAARKMEQAVRADWQEWAR